MTSLFFVRWHGRVPPAELPTSDHAFGNIMTCFQVARATIMVSIPSESTNTTDTFELAYLGQVNDIERIVTDMMQVPEN